MHDVGLKADRFPYTNFFLAAIFACWAAPGVAYFITGSDRTAFLTGSVTCAASGLIFLLLCVPLAGFMHSVRKETRVFDWAMRFMFHVGLPKSKPGWIAANLALAGFFFCTAVILYYTAAGDPKSEPGFIRWLNDFFR